VKLELNDDEGPTCMSSSISSLVQHCWVCAEPVRKLIKIPSSPAKSSGRGQRVMLGEAEPPLIPHWESTALPGRRIQIG